MVFQGLRDYSNHDMYGNESNRQKLFSCRRE